MVEALELLRLYGPVLSSLVVVPVFVLIRYIIRQETASQEVVRRLSRRVGVLEESVKHMPTASALSDLRVYIAELRGEIRENMAAHNGRLVAVIDHLDRVGGQVDRHEHIIAEAAASVHGGAPHPCAPLSPRGMRLHEHHDDRDGE